MQITLNEISLYNSPDPHWIGLWFYGASTAECRGHLRQIPCRSPPAASLTSAARGCELDGVSSRPTERIHEHVDATPLGQVPRDLLRGHREPTRPAQTDTVVKPAGTGRGRDGVSTGLASNYTVPLRLDESNQPERVHKSIFYGKLTVKQTLMPFQEYINHKV